MTARDRKRVVGEITAFVERKAGRVALLAHQAVTSASPVLTGHFRSRWVLSAGQPRVLSPTPPAGTTEQVAAASEQARASNAEQARATSAAYQLAQGRLFIVNNAPYARRLNDGYSAQAPAMFVQEAAAQAVRAAAAEK